MKLVRLLFVFLLGITLLVPADALTQTAKAPPQPAQTAQAPQASQTPQPPPAAPSMSGAAIIDHLNQAISWYQHLLNLDINAGQPSDALYLQNARSLANQALHLAFQSAEIQAQLVPEQAPPPAPSGSQPSSQQRIAQAVIETAQRIQQTQSQIQDLNHRIQGARGKKREDLLSQRDALQGKLDLDKTLQDNLIKISGFLTQETTKVGLAGKITDLKRSLPDLVPAAPAAAPGTTKPAPGQEPSKSTRAHSSGLIGQAAILFGQMGDVRDIDHLISETGKVRASAQELQTPLRDSLRTLLQQGREAADQPPTTDPAQRQAAHQKMDELTAKFKVVSNAAVPLRQEMIVLDQCRANLLEWRNSIEKEYGRVLGSLLTRVLVILFALLLVMILSEIWRRATLRYVRELRRRRQLLLLRRFATGFLMGVVILLGFISEFSSLATFAGFLTAGVAVALQTVILSAAAYFFLIGRYGVRVGDRITVSGVTGDVINIGLVRFHMMELGGTGIDLYPTGRVVVFSNSVLFQAAPFFKQIPGTAYTWHEAAVRLAPDGSHEFVEKKLLEEVNSIYSQYRERLERQHDGIENILDMHISAPKPQGKLQFVDGGLEFVVRYPVEIERASEIDDQVTRKLMELIGSDPELKKAVSGVPKLRSAIKG